MKCNASIRACLVPERFQLTSLVRIAFILCCIPVLFQSCTEYPDPVIKTVESYSFQVQGSGQIAFAGDTLDNSIGVKVYENYSGTPVAGWQVELEVAEGGGSLGQASGHTDVHGRFATYWKLGEASNQQVVKVFFYSAAGEFRNELEIRATGFSKSGWSTVSGFQGLHFNGMVTDSETGITYAQKGFSFLKQEGRYWEWVSAGEITIPDCNLILPANDGQYYAATGSGYIYKGPSLTGDWTECSRPFEGSPSYFRFRVTSDNTLWAEAAYQPLKSSRDGGMTWVLDSAGMPDDMTLIDIGRTSDGHFFYLSTNCKLFRSTDGGHHWTNVPVPNYPLKLYVTPDDGLLLFTQDYGMSLYRSDDQGETFTRLISRNAQFHTVPMPECVFPHAEGYYVFIPGYGILNTTDFMHFTNFWKNYDAYRMFVTADGDIYVTGLFSNDVNVYHSATK